MDISIDDDNQIPDILDAIQKISNLRIEVGVFGEEESFLLMIANVHEYGMEIEVTEKMRRWYALAASEVGLPPLRADTTHITIPERSFLRSTFDESEEKIADIATNLISRVIALEMDAQSAMEKIGQFMVGEIQKKMRSVDSPPNHPLTTERKGSSNPLIDTGRLRQSITYRVVSI